MVMPYSVVMNDFDAELTAITKIGEDLHARIRDFYSANDIRDGDAVAAVSSGSGAEQLSADWAAYQERLGAFTKRYVP